MLNKNSFYKSVNLICRSYSQFKFSSKIKIGIFNNGIVKKNNRFVYINKFYFNNKKDIPDELKGAPQEDMSREELEKSQTAYDSDSEDPTSFYNQRKKLFYWLTSSAIIIIGVYIGLNYLKPDETIPSKRRLGEVTYVGKANIGGPWKLYDTNGNIVTHNDLRGKYYLIYFGFTQCPDVCPMSLQKLSKILTQIRQSKEYKYFDLECIFVSVDPDRDTSERIKTYCQLFDNKIIGLTSLSNDHAELKDMLKKFKIHSSKIYLTKEDEEEDKKNLEKNVPNLLTHMNKFEPKNTSKYSLDHTIVTYLMGPNNNFLTFLSANLSPDEMYNIVLEEIMNDMTINLKSLPIEKNK